MWPVILSLILPVLAMDADFAHTDLTPTTCDQGTLLFPELLGVIQERQAGEFCFDSKYVAIVSKNCQTKCGLIDKAKADKKPLSYSNNGTPGAWLCDRYGGKSQILYLEHKGARQKQSFCILGGDVVSSPYLVQLKGR